MSYTYAQAILCPRCGLTGTARAGEPNPDTQFRMVTCHCPNQSCTFYGRTWYLAIDPENRVVYHTHTPLPKEP